MRNHDITRQINRIRELVQRVDQACGGDLELQAHWARYVCVLTSGLIENSARASYTDFAGRAASAPVAKHTASVLTELRNPKTERLLTLAGRFKNEWRIELEVFATENGRREAVDAIMSNRHLIAHGQGHNSNLSLATVEGYFVKSVEVLEFIEGQCYR